MHRNILGKKQNLLLFPSLVRQLLSGPQHTGAKCPCCRGALEAVAEALLTASPRFLSVIAVLYVALISAGLYSEEVALCPTCVLS